MTKNEKIIRPRALIEKANKILDCSIEKIIKECDYSYLRISNLLKLKSINIRPKDIENLFEGVDEEDWNRLFEMIDSSGHGKFWNEKLSRIHEDQKKIKKE